MNRRCAPRCRSGVASLLALIAVVALPAAAAAATDETIWYRSLGSEEGLSQHFVTAIAQDRDGFLWFGTVGGLNRWNGYEFQSFFHDADDSASLSSSVILALHADARGRLWVGTLEGLDAFEPEADAFRRYGPLLREEPAARPARVEAIASDAAGRIWFGSFWEGRIHRLDPETGKVRSFDLPPRSAGLVTALGIDRADRLWVATQAADDAAATTARDDRIFVYEQCSELGDGDLPAPREPIRLDDGAGKVLTIVEDGAGRLWLARKGGILRYDAATGAVARFGGGPPEPAQLAGRMIRDVALGPTGELWVLTHAVAGVSDRAPHSLLRLDPERLTAREVTLRERVAGPFGDASPDRLAIDRSGVLWIGTNGGGVRYADVSSGGFSLFPGRIGNLPGLSRSFVRAVAPGRDGTLWVGSPHGLDRIERAGGQVRYRRTVEGLPAAPSGPSVQALREDRDEALWIGTSHGLILLNPKTGATRTYRHDAADPRSLADDWVQVLHEARDGMVWVGTLHGLSRFDPALGAATNYYADPLDSATLPHSEINALHTDAGGTLWVGTAAGLARLAPGTDRPRRVERVAAGADGLGSATVLSFGETVLTPGVLWVGTEQRGLCRLALSDLSVLCFTRRNSAIPDNTVYGILADQDGRLWLSTKCGLACYDPGEGTFRTYGPERGLQSSEFNARAYALAPDGEMLFGGIGGLTSFYPERITDNPFPPSILITAVRAQDHEATPTTTELVYRRGMPRRTAEIDYRRRDLTFEFVALHYSHPSDNRCLYRLDRYDADWQGPVAERSIRYTNLAPGSYTFRVKALSGHGVPSDEEAVFHVVIRPPFHATAWFRALAALALLLAVFGAYRVRVRGLRRRQEELERQVARRTEELQAALARLEEQAGRLQELDAAKSRFFANISHELRTPLTLTLGPLRDVREGRHGPIPSEARAEIELAIRSANQQLELVDQLLALARLDAGQVEFRPRRLRLDECVRLAAAPFEALARRQGTRFDIDLRAGAVHGNFDGEKLERIVGNLLGNAFKFTPPGGSVALRLSSAPRGWVQLEVEDTGPGIPARDLPRVFERFYRGERTGSEVPGTGIGLALVREFVQLHGGEVRAENRPGGGARFTVRLPATVPVPEDEAGDAESVARGSGPEPIPAPPDRPIEEHGGANRPTVLVVDDHDDMRAYLRKHLAPHFHLLEASAGDRGLQLARDEHPDLVVSDVMMAGLDGHSLCRALKANPETDFIPVILLTAKADPADRLEGLEGGADDYLTKPFDPAELLARTRNLLRLRERLRARAAAPGASPAGAPAPAPPPEDSLPARLRRVLGESSHDPAFDVPALAARLGMSRAQLHRRFPEELGATPAEAIIRFRLERAAEMLSRRAGNIGEIAYAVGFKNLSHFVRRFRELYGQTPAAYAASRPEAPDAPARR
ncbi:MAG: ATP-binding protein [Acidobacteria bacterium]|jgi:signal transduction histidine kinase/ligand-binding sensor domain-containing protein/DNA-binding response OmpR family regulator|nr:ATP-binding protein [Acidobacteriota bacterium]